MMSNKTVITLTLLILSIKYVASTSPSIIPKKTEKAVPLQDTNNQMTDVPVAGGTPVQVEDQPVPVIDERFKELIEQEEYEEIRKLAETMDKDVFIAQIFPVVKTHEQYKKLKNCFKQHKMVEHFYVNGDMTVVKDDIIVGKSFYDTEELQRAIGLALRGDKHERVCELLKARQEGTAEVDMNCQKGWSSFEYFMIGLFSVLAFWMNTKPLARFITFHGNEFSDKYPDIYSIFCERLVGVTCVNSIFGEPGEKEKARKLLSDLVCQPSLLTPVTFSRGLLYDSNDFNKTGFIEYGWQDAIKEGLNGKYEGGCKHLWNAIKKKYPGQHFGDFPPSVKVLDAVLKLFPTKQEREEAWDKAHAPIPRKELENLKLGLELFPKVLWILISEYNAPLWSDAC